MPTSHFLTVRFDCSIIVELLNNKMTMLADPTRAFEALAHDVRLAVIRQLIPAGADGLPAGALADRVGQAPNALSFHLGRLVIAGLVRMRRAGRNQYYAVDYQQLSALVSFLVEDCCANAPRGCMPGCPSMPKARAPGVKRKLGGSVPEFRKEPKHANT